MCFGGQESLYLQQQEAYKKSRGLIFLVKAKESNLEFNILFRKVKSRVSILVMGRLASSMVQLLLQWPCAFKSLSYTS